MSTPTDRAPASPNQGSPSLTLPLHALLYLSSAPCKSGTLRLGISHLQGKQHATCIATPYLLSACLCLPVARVVCLAKEPPADASRSCCSSRTSGGTFLKSSSVQSSVWNAGLSQNPQQAFSLPSTKQHATEQATAAGGGGLQYRSVETQKENNCKCWHLRGDATGSTWPHAELCDCMNGSIGSKRDHAVSCLHAIRRDWRQRRPRHR